MIIGTAGHIDHGKTSLVRALTGIDTDRLPEEKARSITLDLGFAYVPTPDGKVLGFVDVPGHERLIHTMIAGASSIGMALLVVAADDGVMPQTREHLQILSLLGISHGIVALTKVDLVDADRIIEVELEIATLLEDTALAEAEVFPVSTITGAGIDRLRNRLMKAAALDVKTEDADDHAFRLAVDRSFSLPGAGTVVTGPVVAGTIEIGQTVLILPSGLTARVRGIHAANRAVDRTVAGERCALNLVGPGIRKDAIGRGDWITDPGHSFQSQRCDAWLSLLPAERTTLKSGTSVLVHHGAGHVSARVVMLEPAALAPSGSGLAHLVLDRPLPVRHADRLVLRDASAARTIAGGRVLDPRPPNRYRRASARLATLHALTASDPIQAFRARLSHLPLLIRRDVVLSDWGLTESGLARAIGDGATVGDFVMTSASLQSLTEAVTDAIVAFHIRQPTAPGISAGALRLTVPIRVPRDAFTALIGFLVGKGTIASQAHLLRAPGHRGSLATADAVLWDAVRPLLEAAPFRPPLLRDAAATLGITDVMLRRACKGFARMGLVQEVAPDRFFLRSAVVAMAEAAHALSDDVGAPGFTAAQFRDRLDNGRQLAIQILDHFDRRGITVRRGDLRRAGKSVAAVFGA